MNISLQSRCRRPANVLRMAAGLLAAAAFLASLSSQAQEAGGVSRHKIVSASAAPTPGNSFQLPTARQRFHQYLSDTFGPPAFVAATAFAAIDQSRNAPPEWKQNSSAFARRFSSNFGEAAMEETVRYGMAGALREDTRFDRCTCSGFFPRLGHGLFSSVTARSGNGNRILSAADVTAPFAGGLAATAAWYPSRFGPEDGLRWGLWSLGVHAGIGVIREFLPFRR